ncbi:hypothetical protein L5515_001374 [Caenorhabditis briggsae]|uniref:RING-type domain-containing protein n=2 Tax=Caenorhabditis briggsae TaxID=6238 RepID=A0AAE9DT92_CAEBR|nr:hypothetical protein L3Y34_015295 [Caenorhabditis briggsae]UMM12754.1 hypothetical protein L5515_001374 [Caenorhabditis briggsae]
MTTADDLFGDVEMGTLISCPVCRDTFNLNERCPLNIPCGHTVCTQCSNSLLPHTGAPVMMCPVCRKKHIGQIQNGVCRFPFPKNFQLLEVIEKVVSLKQRADKTRAERRSVKCMDCKKTFADDMCTTCSCVLIHSNNDFDFLGRATNKLICVSCVHDGHKNHDVKPMEAVKATSDNRHQINQLMAAAERAKNKIEGAKISLNNCLDELNQVCGIVDQLLTSVKEHSKNGNLICLTSKSTVKIKSLENNASDIAKSAHKDATSLGIESAALQELLSRTNNRVSETGLRPSGDRRPPILDNRRPAQQNPVAARDAVPVAQVAEQGVAQPPPENVGLIRAEEAEPEAPPMEEDADVDILIRIRDDAQREGRVREIMEQLMRENPDAAPVGGAFQVPNGERIDERFNGLVQGVFHFLDDMVAREPNNGQGAADGNADNDQLLDEIVLLERDNRNENRPHLVRRRIQVRFQIQNEQPQNEEARNEDPVPMDVRDDDEVIIVGPAIPDDAGEAVVRRGRGRPPGRGARAREEQAMAGGNGARRGAAAVARGNAARRGDAPAAGRNVAGRPAAPVAGNARRRGRPVAARHNPINQDLRGGRRNRRQNA